VLTDPGRVDEWAVGEVAVAEHPAGARAILHRRTGGRSRAVVAMDTRPVLDLLVATLAAPDQGPDTGR